MLRISKQLAQKSSALLRPEVEDTILAILDEQIEVLQKGLNSGMAAEAMRVQIAKIEAYRELKGIRTALQNAYDRQSANI